MAEKRYFAHKHNKVHDKICHNFMGLDETVEHMNNQYWKYKQLKEENEQLRDVNAQCCNDYSAMRRDVLRYKEENEQLKNFIRKEFPKSYKHILEGFE